MEERISDSLKIGMWELLWSWCFVVVVLSGLAGLLLIFLGDANGYGPLIASPAIGQCVLKMF